MLASQEAQIAGPARPGRGMPGLAALASRFAVDRPLDGYDVLLNLHLSDETARLGETLACGGASVVYLNSGVIQPSAHTLRLIAARQGRVLGGLDDLPLAQRPMLVVEGNGRVFSAIHADARPPPAMERIRAISVHTSGGGHKVDAFEAAGGRMRVPIVAVYRSALKAKLETGLGTAQSAAAALLRGLGAPVSGRRVAIVGFGNVGRGLARILRTLGARLSIVEARPEAALEAVLGGYAVLSLTAALPRAEIVVTTTGNSGVITAEALEHAREDQVLATLGDRPDEIDIAGCQREGQRSPHLAAWRTPGGRRFWLLGGGVQLNHVIGRGNPAELMDLSFSLHALSLAWLAATRLAPGVAPPPLALREEAARLCLEAMT